MKKILMMIAVMAVACLTASAQNEVGQFTLQPKVGMNIVNLTGANYPTVGTSTQNSSFFIGISKPGNFCQAYFSHFDTKLTRVPM